MKTKEVLEPKDYLKYTSYKNILQIRRLNLIVDGVLNYAKDKYPSEISILELGCGIGAVSFPLSSFGFKLVGIDIDQDSIKSCNAKNPFPETASYIVSDAQTLSLEKKFDIVVATEILEHCPHPERVVDTLYKHLNADGIGIVTTPNGYCLSEIIFSRLFQKLGIHTLFHKLPRKIYTALTGSPTPYYSMNVFCHHVQFFTYSKFKNLLEKGGCRILSVSNLDLGMVLDWKWLSLLKKVEFKLATYVPHYLAGGWVFAISRSVTAQSEKR